MTFTIDQKIAVLERQIVSLKKVWAERLRQKQDFAVHHLSVLKAIAADLREQKNASPPSTHT